MDRMGVDSHLHIFDDRYPFIDNPRYFPPCDSRGNADQLTSLLQSHGLSHALLVAASPYGGDMRPVLDAISGSKGRFKGIALLPDPNVSDMALQRLSDGGIVGARVNLAMGLGHSEIEGPARKRLFARMAEMGWFIEVHCEGDDLKNAMPILGNTGCRLLVDHCGRPDPDLGVEQPGFQALLALGREGSSVVKLSGAFRFSRAKVPFQDTDEFFLAAIDAFGLDRCVWGSDWPFVNAGERVDYGPQLACLRRWLPDEDDQRRVLWETPAAVFGFN